MNKKNEVNTDSGDKQHPIASSSVNSSSASNASENENNVHDSVPLSSTQDGVRHVQEGESTRAGPSTLRSTLKNEPVSTSSFRGEAFARRPVAGFDPRNPQVPPGMTSTRAKNLANRISMLTSSQNYVVISPLLNLSDGLKVKYTRDMWAMALYNVSITYVVFDHFTELASRSNKWAKVVLETICFLKLKREFVTPPLTAVISDENITVPPEIDQNRAIGFIYLLKFMKRGNSSLRVVLGWLLMKIHTSAFRKMFANTLVHIQIYNRDYFEFIQEIFYELASEKKWVDIIVQ